MYEYRFSVFGLENNLPPLLMLLNSWHSTYTRAFLEDLWAAQLSERENLSLNYLEVCFLHHNPADALEIIRGYWWRDRGSRPWRGFLIGIFSSILPWWSIRDIPRWSIRGHAAFRRISIAESRVLGACTRAPAWFIPICWRYRMRIMTKGSWDTLYRIF